MINIILPWQSMMGGGGFYNFPSRLNMAAYHLIFGSFIIIVVSSFIFEVKAAKKLKKKHFIKRAIRKWWTTY